VVYLKEYFEEGNKVCGSADMQQPHLDNSSWLQQLHPCVISWPAVLRASQWQVFPARRIVATATLVWGC
jgi:hypothetical protein